MSWTFVDHAADGYCEKYRFFVLRKRPCFIVMINFFFINLAISGQKLNGPITNLMWRGFFCVGESARHFDSPASMVVRQRATYMNNFKLIA